ncbi:MAG: ABA4-like family protein [Cypionkella sp.]
MWQSLFTLTNVVALAAWAVLIALPRKPFPLALALYGGVGLLCLAYAAMFAALFGGLADPVRDAGAPLPSLANYSVDGLQAFFRSDGGLVLGWTHYLAFDLFTGLWIARDADAKGFSRLAQAPVLLATFLAGPIGLLAWLLVRERRARAAGWARNGTPGR